MSQRVATCVLVLMIGMFSAELRADTINQSSGFSSVTIAFIQPIGQTFQWTSDPGLGSIGFTFVNMNPTEPNQPITVTLRAGSGFGGPVLRSVTQTLPAALPGPSQPPGLFVDFDFSGVALSPGIYTAAVTTFTGFKIGLNYSTTDPYSGGAMLFTLDPGQTFLNGLCTNGGSCDLNFRVTPTSSTPVPEPSSLSFLAGGLFLLPAFVRRQRKTVHAANAASF